MDWKEKRFLVFGSGISGVAACGLLRDQGIETILYDGNEALDVIALRKKNPVLESVPIYVGELPEDVLAEMEVAVLSPGVPTDLPLVERMRKQGIQIWGEIELAYVFGKGSILAITGTNGKTTTTTLLGMIMKQAYEDVRVVGNIGVPYTRIAGTATKDTIIVAEISSFQLETIHEFCPEVSAILNITPDHLDRHHTMENYINAKKNITANQSGPQTCVLNYEDKVLREFGSRLNQHVVYFSSARPLEEGVYLDEGKIWYRDGKAGRLICNTEELQIFGIHNYENVMAAAAMALSFGVPIEKIHSTLVQFQAVEHRIEYVATKRGIRFYNDSKGTNPDAAIQAVRAMQWPTLLIGGGYDKGSSYETWIQAFGGKVKKLALLGATREKIAKTAVECGFPQADILFVESLEEAVEKCYENAKEGDAVLLSPACASWGMFRNYEERGNLFKEIVKDLKE